MNRIIVADAFFAKTKPGVTPAFATVDRGIYNPLLKIAGINPQKLGRPAPETFPNGFDVTINGRTLLVIPLPDR